MLPLNLYVGPTQAPQALNASVISPHHAFLLWEPPEERQRNGHIRKYHIEVDSEDGLVNYTSIQENFNLTSLHPYYIYTVRIAAVTVEEGPHAILAFQTHEAGKEYCKYMCIKTIVETSCK